jgi:DNA polymerase III subunit epsilon
LKTQNKFWWFTAVAFVATLMVLLTIALLFWYQLQDASQRLLIELLKDNFAYLFVAGVVLFTGFGFTLEWFCRAYIIPVNQLAEKTELINTVNPDFRIDIDGSPDVMRLARIINQCAENQTNLKKTVAQQLQLSKAESESEKDVLAALLGGLSQGILVCNIDGRIVFYNRKIKTLLARQSLESAAASQWIGLDRSIYTLIEKTLISQALERISQKITAGEKIVNERFLVSIHQSAMLPAEIIPILDAQHHMTGFIVYIEDAVAKLQKQQEVSKHLQAWQHQLTQSIAVIKTATEILQDESLLSEQDRRQMIQIISQETHLTAQLLTRHEVTAQWRPDQPLPLTVVDAVVWGRYFVKRIAESIGMDVQLHTETLQALISVDMHHLTNALIFVVQQVKKEQNLDGLQGHFYQRDAWLYLDLIWTGNPIDHLSLEEWKRTIPYIDNVSLGISLTEILAYHGAKLWICRHHMPAGCSALRLLLPAIQNADVGQESGHVTILPDSRPEFYDFNLFQQSDQTPDLDQQQLMELTYTVFDTETTGLDPQGGDEIISIGAVRIVNGRLLQNEQFNRLVDPQRHLPWTSIKYHGIRPEMLEGQPTIDRVLPDFFQFAQGTVLVGHNVAFDMRMLELKEALTGIRFSQPVLDTMLLSAMLHPAHESHNLGAIAERVGVTILGRHTALGDATATGEIFLKLLSLMAQKGIHTFGQAIVASKKTLYARLKY